MFATMLLVLAITILALALVLRRSSGLPWAVVVYDDTGRREVARPLFSARYGLTGKPDYLLDRRGTLIPVEVKPSRRASEPYESDIMQLAAYCLLIEETRGEVPDYGLLRYAETTFRIPYTPRLRTRLLALLDQLRNDAEANDCDRSHNEQRRCQACGFFSICDQALE